jgi:hypothetical protein
MTLREVLTEYISWKRELGGLFDSGAGRLRSFEKHIGHVKLRDISKLHIRTFLDGLQVYLKLAPERFRKQLAQISDDRERPHWRKDRKLMRFLDGL